LTDIDSNVENQHWFAGKELSVLIFKVNRRPPDGLPFYNPPEIVYEHLKEVMNTHISDKSGRRYQRNWRIGNIIFDDKQETIRGRLGWSRSSEKLSQAYDDKIQAWVDQVISQDAAAVAPFAFQAKGELLGVLRHPDFDVKTLITILSQLLNRGERYNREPTTIWAVEPVGDEIDFNKWINEIDILSSIKFVFHRPNPSARRSFEDANERIDNIGADQITEDITVDKNKRKVGLNKEGVKIDPISKGYIDAGMAGYGYVVGKGKKNGQKNDWDQRVRVRVEMIEAVSPDYENAGEQIVIALKRLWKRLNGEKQA
jgi:hypothetical protein